ncbi:MAG: hypothetical protein AB8B55_11655 [Mariniblastus sp.]
MKLRIALKFENTRPLILAFVGVVVLLNMVAPFHALGQTQQTDLDKSFESSELKSILEFADGSKPGGRIAGDRIAVPETVPSIDEPKMPPAPSETSADAGEDIDKLLTRLVLENIPHDFEETKDWGGQSERWDGIKIWRENGRLETKRRKKKVNDGTWKKYSAELLNPNEEFAIQVKNMRETAEEKLAFDVHFQAHLKIDGRQSKWVKGVQLYSIGFEGHTKVRLVVSIELEVKMDVRGFPPDMVFVPRSTGADIVVDDFRLDRIGKAGGEFAQQVSRGIRKKLDEKVAQKKQKLVDKINKQFEKKQDEFRVSIADAMKSKWTSTAKVFLPKSVQEALDE